MTTATTNNRLNLRSGADTSASILETLEQGVTVTVLDTQGEWLHVQAADGQSGYVSAAYVTQSDGGSAAAAPAAAPSTPATRMLIAAPTGAQLNIRSSAGVTTDPDNKLEQVSAGVPLIPQESDASVAAKVGTTQAQNQWIQVQTPSGKIGYAAAWFVQYAPDAQPVAQAQPVVSVPVVEPVQTQPAPVVQPAVQPAQSSTAPGALPGNLQVYFDFIAAKTDTPPIPQGYHDFQALAGQIGLPAPFDMLPTQQTNESIRNSLIVNGFGPNTFAQQHWHDWYSATDGMHNGLDHIVSAGTPLLAVADGVIVGTEQNWKFLGSNDKCVILWPFMPPSVVDGQGRRTMSNVLVAYAHLSDNSKVQRHQVVKAGDVIGLSGAPGGNVGNNDHLHLEVHLLTGDNNLPVRLSDHHLADYQNDQPFGAITPLNPLLFFSERMINLHTRVGKKGNGGSPSYPTDPAFDFFSVGQYQYSPGLVIWNHLNQAWPNGIFDVPTLVNRARSYAPFTPYPTDFLSS